jgi:type IV secretory pathway VirJ component
MSGVRRLGGNWMIGACAAFAMVSVLAAAAAMGQATSPALAAPSAGTAKPATQAPPPDDVFDYGRFGTVSVYRGHGEPRDVVLFLSGDGGWNLGVISMAKKLVDKGAIVAGIDIRHYLAQLEAAPGQCVSPADDLDKLSHELQSKLGLKRYLEPTLVGYSSGATLVYATMGEAADGVFKGALSLGFCPDLDLKKPVCKGAGIEATPRRDAKGVLKGVNFLAVKKLAGQWISLQGETDQVCPAPATQQFIATVPGGEIVMLPKVGHGYSVERNWVPQYEAAFAKITAQQAVTHAPAPTATQ